jgi:hypothetical protein
VDERGRFSGGGVIFGKGAGGGFDQVGWAGLDVGVTGVVGDGEQPAIAGNVTPCNI